MKHDTIKPSLRRRYEFIEFQLMWDGTVGRRRLQDQFEISPQQATLDLTSYLEIAPRNMVYDPRQRTYVATAHFRSIFLKGEASEYLQQLEMVHRGYRHIGEVWPAEMPSFDAVDVATRRIAPATLKSVLHAIRTRKCTEVTYVSLSSETEGPRHLFPHAIASDGHRWHMRAFDADKGRYSDFVLSRVDKIKIVEHERDELPEDLSWQTFVALRLQPDPALPRRQKEQLQLEYDMDNGELCVNVRKAMMFYYLRHYGFDPLEMEGSCMRNKSSFHLSIANLVEVEESLGRR
ncbi:WYL domain-containing protein [Nitratireductor sp. StC3]|uniref:WYL domain-containing protein n=1 Tax=Nitratireductor sp. StC3 TaxID=2126741 RepID=UPI000D0DF5F4|nr:WYL domain-containing protein [Nitratireductor sp. StC3]PSM19865.1 WYL domain-containing protein [Nitratireductor sp. StC3]